MEEPLASQMPFLEGWFRQYSDLPREVVVKEAVLTYGLALEPGAFSDSSALPKVLELEGGPFGLRRTLVRVAVEEGSPYLLEGRAQDAGDGPRGGLTLVDRASGTEVAAAWAFPRNPVSGQKTFPDGLRYGELVSPDGEVTVLEQCHLRRPGLECPFCSINEAARRASAEPAPRDPQQVAQAVAECLLAMDSLPRERPVALRITGGSIVGDADGLDEEEFYLQYVRAIRERIGRKVPLLLEMTPKPLDVEKRLQSEGVDARLSNLEVWDPKLFSRLCPGKEQTVGWDEWVRRLLDQVYVYGWNGVLPGLVIGLEMVAPSGFKDVNEAVASTTEGMRFLARHGVVPRPVHLRADPLSAMKEASMPPVELFLGVDLAWYDLFLQYGQAEPICFLMGPGRSRYADSAAFDVGRGAPLQANKR